MDVKYEPLPDIESNRLAALDSYDILDTLPEKEYDAITRLASYICQTPLAFISFIDGKRQWFKSSMGLDMKEIPIGDSFCQYTILQDNIVEIPDATLHPQFSQSDYVTSDFGLRFYAGTPLVDPEGHRVGTICVFDKQPKTLTDEQRDALSTLAGEVISHLLLRKQKKALEESLQKREQFFRLFNNSPEIHLIAGADAIIELINRSAEGILGYTVEQITGRALWSFVAGHNREQFVPVIEKAVATGQPFEIETETVTLNGEHKWISWTAIYQNEKWYCSGRDITFQKAVLKDLKQLSLVASKIKNGVSISNADDKVIWVNDAFKDITGYTLQEVEDTYIGQVLKGKPKDTVAEIALDKARETKSSYEIELLVTHKKGHQLWVSVSNSVILDNSGQVEKYIRIIIDISERKQAEQDVEILSSAARKSPSGIMIRDKKGGVMWMNSSMENIIGYSINELKGKELGTLLLGEESDMGVYHDALKAVAENKPYEVEIKIYKKDGSIAWVQVNNSPFFNETGSVERQIGVMVDITERKKIQDQLSTLSLVASSTTSGVVINDASGEVEWVNDAFERITGYTIDEVKGSYLGDVLTGELTDAATIQRSRELSQRKQSFEVDILVYRKDGQPLWLSVLNSVVTDNDGQVSKYIEVIIDITAKKKAEAELIAAKEEALQLSRAKDMFISVMSHEIRTPLNAVIGMSHLLLEDNPLEAQKENLNVLKFSADNLMTLINDVLDFTKIETGNVELEKADIDLRVLINSITASMQYKVQEKGIYLTNTIGKDVPHIILGDKARLTQILLNLVSNSVKFTASGGVNIDLKVVEDDANAVHIRFAVSDTGIGIAKDKLSTIFESFKQAEKDTTRKYGGTGLGLAISKRLIELHDSRINVDSIQGEGSTFWFTISFKKIEVKNTINNTALETGLNINILVADDNQINRLLINKVLKKWGANADFAENGKEAVNKIESDAKYDVVLMDINMPVMGGLEATEMVRAMPEPYFQQLPIIALTASMLTDEMGEIENAGMNDYILKPFDPQALFEKLSQYQKQ